MTYAWLAFVLTSLVEPGDPIRWVGNIAFAIVALALVLVARRRIRTVPKLVTNHTKTRRFAWLVTTFRQGTRLQSMAIGGRIGGEVDVGTPGILTATSDGGLSGCRSAVGISCRGLVGAWRCTRRGATVT